MSTPTKWLNKEDIYCAYSFKSDSLDLKIINCIDSTNSYLSKRINKQNIYNKPIQVIAAELQTNGRGRAGRIWHSGLGNCLTFSLQWCFKRHSPDKLVGLSLVVGVAIIRVLRNSCESDDIKLKWPNDVLYNQKKLAGTLIELRNGLYECTFAVIGIGINFKLTNSMKAAISQAVTDLCEINCAELDRNQILGNLLSELKIVLSDFEKHGFSYFREEWIRYHAFDGQSVCLHLPDDKIEEGIVDGVDNSGAIALITPNGKKLFNIGDVSLRSRLS